MRKRHMTLIAFVAIFLTAIIASGCQSGNAGSTQSTGGLSGAATPTELLAKVSQSTANLAAISGKVSWNNDVFGLSSLSGGIQGNGSISALLSKGSGRLWVKSGEVRLEIQGSNGDTIVNGDSSHVWVYSSQDNTATEYLLPAKSQSESSTTSVAGTTTTDLVSSISNALSRLAPDATVTVAAQQTKVAGRNCYVLSLVPKAANTVFGSLRVLVDAEKFIPLQIDVYAKGNTVPVLTAGFTSVSFSDFNSNLFSFTPPANAKVQHQNIAANEASSATTTAAGTQGKTVPGATTEQQPLTIAQATAQAGFTPLTAHVTDATLAFAGAYVIQARNIPLTFNPLAMAVPTSTQGAAAAAKIAEVGPTVVQRYGQGFGTILLVEAKAPAQFITQLERQFGSLSPLVTRTHGAPANGPTIYYLNSSLGSVAIWSRSGYVFAAAGSVSQDDIVRFYASVH